MLQVPFKQIECVKWKNTIILLTTHLYTSLEIFAYMFVPTSNHICLHMFVHIHTYFQKKYSAHLYEFVNRHLYSQLYLNIHIHLIRLMSFQFYSIKHMLNTRQTNQRRNAYFINNDYRCVWSASPLNPVQHNSLVLFNINWMQVCLNEVHLVKSVIE